MNFTNASYIWRDLRLKIAAMDTPCRAVILEGNGVIAIDYTAAQIIMETIRDLRMRNVDFAIARLESERAQVEAIRTELIDVIGPERIFKSVEEAVTVVMRETHGTPAALSRPST